MIKLIRDGKTYSIGNVLAGTIIKFEDTGYYLKTQQWMIKDYFPITDGDILVIEGRFINAGLGVIFEIEKTYVSYSEGILTFSTEYPSEDNKVEVINAGTMSSHPKGKEGTDGFYFTMAENDIPLPESDVWAVEYFPASADVIKLIRDGKTYSIGNVLAGTIIKFEDTGYYLKTQQWMIKDYFPITDGDILVIEGRFINAGMGVLFDIEKTYVSFAEGVMAFSTEYPSEDTGVQVIQAGTMSSHPNGKSDNGIYFTLAENDLSYDNWSVEFIPASADVIKLIRDGETYDIGNVLAGTIVKFRDTEYFLKLEQWIIKDKYPIRDGDILIVEGRFANAGLGEIFEIEKTYISVKAGMAYFTTDYPTGEEGPTVINGGTMSSHPNGWSSSSSAAGGLYFKLDVNDAPYESDWSLRYTPKDASVVKLIRDGVTYDVANTGAEMLVKYGESDYYLEFWPVSYKPILSGDILIVEGSFVNAANEVVLTIDKTYVALGIGSAVFSTEYPGEGGETEPTEPETTEPETTEPEVEDGVINAGTMSNHANGWNTGNNNGFSFTLAANSAPYDGWNIEYTPVDAGVVQLIRDGNTYDITRVTAGTIVKFGETDYYFKLESWMFSDYYPIVPGDVLIVEGKFYCMQELSVILKISKTYITVGDGYTLSYSAAEPEVPDTTEPQNDGPLMPHNNGIQISGLETLIYGTMEPNSGVQNGWETEYTPENAANLKLIRDGVTYDVGNPGQGTLVKYSNTEYCLKLAPWTITGSRLPLVAGDMIVVEGAYVGKSGTSCEGSTIVIEKTTITYNADGTVTFEYEEEDVTEPTEPDDGKIYAGSMQAHPDNGWTASGGLYFTMVENDASYNGWNIRYTPTAESNVKLIRNGVTYDVGHTLRETICKYSATEYYYEFWTLGDYKPVQAGDVLIVEGDFKYGDVIMNISKTTITFNADGTATFESEAGETDPTEPETTEPEVTEPDSVEPDTTEPEVTEPESQVLQVGNMTENASGLTDGILYFTLTDNDLPSNLTKSDYRPVSSDAIVLVRDGQSYEIGDPTVKTVVKQSASKYRLLRSALTMDLQDGDMLIISGNFTGGRTDQDTVYTFCIATTYIVIENGTAVFYSEDPRT